jgi:hypothetical protein
MTKWCKAWPDSCITNSISQESFDEELVNESFDKSLANGLVTPKALIDEAFPDEIEQLKKHHSKKNDSNERKKNDFHEKKNDFDEKKNDFHEIKSLPEKIQPKNDIAMILVAVVSLVALIILASILSRLSNLENDIKLLFLRKE